MVNDDDWRLRGQERFLTGATLRWAKWKMPRPEWDHDHCEFCFAKFMEAPSPEVLHEGFTTEDNYRWVCRQCFDDFKDRFQWKIAEQIAS